MGRNADRGSGLDALARALARLERREWGDKAFPLGYFRSRLGDERAVIAVLRTADRELAGFVIAMPDDRVRDALYVEDTLITRRYRGRGYVAQLGRAVEREARRRGFRFLTRDAAIANGYADAVERAYVGRVVERRDHASEYGPQRYLKIALRAGR